jgi:DNA modification methylase
MRGDTELKTKGNCTVAVITQEINDNYAIWNGDCCEVMPTLPDESVHLSIYSPPFAVEVGGCLYNYSSSPADLSNSRTYDEFFEHYGFVVEQIARLTMPGRITAVHCMDVPKKGANIAGYSDFPGEIIKLHERHGFEYLPRVCVWKEPLAVRNRTMAKGLTHRQIVEDATQTNMAACDYLIPFRKKGANPVPVVHPHGLMDYAGCTPIPEELKRYRGWKGNQIENRYSHWIWRRYASSFWDDIRGNQGNRELDEGAVLAFKDARDSDDEKHMHPLQLDVITRACVLWSNPGENVLTPFMGVGSEVYGAVTNHRRGLGVELKTAYYNQAVKNLAAALESRPSQGELF